MPVMAMVVMAVMVISIMSTPMYRLFKNDSGSKSSAKSTTVVVMMRVMVMKVRMVVVVLLVACHNGTCNHSSRNGSGHVGLLRRSLPNDNHP